MLQRCEFMQELGAAGVGTAAGASASAPGVVERVEVWPGQGAGRLNHIWSRCAGSDRAIINLREEWRADLDRFRREVGLERVRFHGVIADEMGIVSVFGSGKAPNWQDVDAVDDCLLDRAADPSSN